MHSAGLELTKLTYTRLEDNLIRHRGDRRSLYEVPGTTTKAYVVTRKRCWLVHERPVYRSPAFCVHGIIPLARRPGAIVSSTFGLFVKNYEIITSTGLTAVHVFRFTSH